MEPLMRSSAIMRAAIFSALAASIPSSEPSSWRKKNTVEPQHASDIRARGVQCASLLEHRPQRDVAVGVVSPAVRHLFPPVCTAGLLRSCFQCALPVDALYRSYALPLRTCQIAPGS
jgi:hypothetical protein